MARTDNLTNFCTDIANAIRTKSNLTGTIPANQFDTKISQIETGIDTSDATAVAGDILAGKTAYVKDEKITGTMNKGDFINGIIQEAKAQGVVNAGDFVRFLSDYSEYNQTNQKQIFNIGSFSYRGLYISATVLDENTVFIAHSYHISGDANYSLRGIVCKIINGTITFGTDTQIVPITHSPGNNSFSTVSLDENRVFLLYGHKTTVQGTDTRHLYAIACRVTGTTITTGNSTALDTTFGTGHFKCATKLDENKVIVAYSYPNSSSILTDNNQLCARVCTISQISISYSARTQLSTVVGSGLGVQVKMLNRNKIIIAHTKDATQALNALVCTIDGDTIVKGTDTQLSSIKNSFNDNNLLKLNENTVLISHKHGTSNELYALVCMIDGDTIVKGTDTQLSSITGSNLHSSVKLNKNTILIVYENAGLYAMICNISNMTITVNDPIKICSRTYAGKLIANSLNESNIFLIYNNEDKSDLYAMTIEYIVNLVKTITSSTERIDGIAISDGQAGEMVTTVRPDDVLRATINATISTENYGSITFNNVKLEHKGSQGNTSKVNTETKVLEINGINYEFSFFTMWYETVREWRVGFSCNNVLYSLDSNVGSNNCTWHSDGISAGTSNPNKTLTVTRYTSANGAGTAINVQANIKV